MSIGKKDFHFVVLPGNGNYELGLMVDREGLRAGR